MGKTKLKLTHNDLVSLGTLLGYPGLKDGLCFGFSGMWMQAVFAKDEESFDERLDFISTYKNDFQQLKNEIELVKEKVKKNQEISNTDKMLLDILSFYDGVSLYLRPDLHKEIFSKTLQQANADKIFTYTKSDKLREENLLFLSKTRIFNRESLTNYLAELKKILTETKETIPILLGAERHAVSLKFNESTQKWEYTDTSDFSRFPEEGSYHRILETEEEVTQSLLDSFQNDNFLTIRMEAFNINPQSEKLLQISNLFNAIPIVPLPNGVSNKEKINFFNQLLATGSKEECQKVFEFFQDEGIDFNVRSTFGRTPFFYACYGGHEQIARALLEKNNTGSFEEELYAACDNGHLEIIKLFLEKGLYSKENGIPLLIACQEGHQEVVKYLLANKSLNIIEYLGLFNVCRNSHPEITSLLLEKMEFDVQEKDYQTVFSDSCRLGAIEGLHLLQKKHFDFTKNKDEYYTNLMTVCYQGNAQIAKLLLSSMEQHQLLTINDYWSLFNEACRHSNDEIAMELFKKIEKNSIEMDYKNLFNRACQENNPILLNILLKNGFKIEEGDIKPFLITCEQGSDAVFSILLEKDNFLSQEEMSYLFNIACNKNYPTIGLLLLNKLNNPPVMNNYWLLFYCASRDENLDIAKLMLETIEKNVFLSEKNYLTLFNEACQTNHPKIAKFLLSKLGNVNLVDDKSDSPLGIASYFKQYDVVEQLIKEGAHVNHINQYGATPLYLACRGDVTTVELLLVNGASPNQAQYDGWTPLHWACANGRFDMVEKLLGAAADPNVIDYNSQSPLQLARIGGYDKIEAVLLANHAQEKIEITPLAMACKNGHIYQIQSLLDQDRSNAKDALAFQVACKKGDFQLIKLLLENHADPNCIADGPSALEIVSLAIIGTNKKTDILRLLLENGANMTLKNDSGHYVLDVALNFYMDPAIEELLLFAKGKNLPLEKIMSAESREKIINWINNNNKIEFHEYLQITKPSTITSNISSNTNSLFYKKGIIIDENFQNSPKKSFK